MRENSIEGQTGSRHIPAWRQLAAVAVGVLPVLALGIWMHLTRTDSYSLTQMLVYPLVFGGLDLLLIIALLNWLCRERLGNLNLLDGSAARDIGHGLALFFVLVGMSVLSQFTIDRWFARPPSGDFSNLVNGLMDNPLLMLLWFGPVMWIGVAGFEEVTRTFLITRLIKVWPGIRGAVTAVVVSAALFGLAHIYQGWAGVISVGLMGLVKALYYLKWGRLWPLIVSHALYDSAWFAFGLYQFSRISGS